MSRKKLPVVLPETATSVLRRSARGKRMRIAKDSEERSLFDSEAKPSFLEKVLEPGATTDFLSTSVDEGQSLPRIVESPKDQAKLVSPPVLKQKKDSVRAVKDALFFDVQDAIQKLKNLETENSTCSSEFCYDCGDTDEEESLISNHIMAQSIGD
ncbi:unnamed protein product [Brassica napus]|uniref:(rape) hypothetical protein n=1 Tax=Brassica napus TaxID=3708 RepID=A0A816YUI2_BRANA|nr:unnamed protein product [Brassica napus]